MFRLQPSIRQKITFGYYAGVVVIIALSLFTIMELWYTGKKIQFEEVVTEFFDTTLEIRRFEKNYFLYEHDEDYQENMRYVAKAQDILNRNLREYKSLAVAPQLNTIKDHIGKYKVLMEKFALMSKTGIEQRSALEKAIREQGKEIITISEDISKTERKRLQDLLNKMQRTLVWSFIVLSISGIIIGQILSRMVVRPLKSLEEKMKQIAEGKLETVSIKSKDREIVSLARAFNKMLRELEVRRRHLVQTEKLASLGTLLSGVAHELNNPLSNISSSCQILMEEIDLADGEYKKELLSQIDDQTDRAKNIVRSLLEFSRDKEFKKEPISLKGLIEETIVFIKGDIPAVVEFGLDIPDGIVVFADKQRLQQAFLNLIKNAVDSIVGQGVVTIRAWRVPVSSMGTEDSDACPYPQFKGKCADMYPVNVDSVDIAICDTGDGIPPEVLPKIFDPFFTTKDVGKGSGLGLFIVHEIIEEHDGCMGVDSEVGKGTTFLIRLPTSTV